MIFLLRDKIYSEDCLFFSLISKLSSLISLVNCVALTSYSVFFNFKSSIILFKFSLILIWVSIYDESILFKVLLVSGTFDSSATFSSPLSFRISIKYLKKKFSFFVISNSNLILSKLNLSYGRSVSIFISGTILPPISGWRPSFSRNFFSWSGS